MSFFTSNRVKQLLQNNDISSYLKTNKCVLLQKEEVDYYLSQAPLSIGRQTRSRKGKTSSENTRLPEFITKQREIFRQNVMKRLCGVESSPDYYSVLENDPENTDVLFIFREKYKRIPQKIVREQDYIEYKLSQLYGIVIVRRNECPSNPLLYTIVQCCSFVSHFVPLLMGISMLIVKNDPEFRFKRLLAYRNESHKNMYQLFGFQQDDRIECSDKSRPVVLVDFSAMPIEEVTRIALSKENTKKITSPPSEISIATPVQQPKKSVKDLIAEYERKIQSHKGGKRRRTKRRKRVL